ncbi:MAG: hypothetical protein B6D61_05560 [Bacteroidetes bacterium 4484_249]|nr:MAG: hypothetical protein B6D61_05560 [Bacteroidetes bacterium 4484_249]
MANNEVNEPYVPYGKPATFEQVWRMFQETDRMLSEKFEETDKQFKETREMFKDTDKRFQDTDKKIKELSNLFTTQWGKLVESLVEGDLVNVLNRWGINVERTLQRVKGNRNGENFEYDIIAVNGEEIVIVEVKTTLRVQDVNWFHEKLYKAKQFMPEYKERKIYGAVAFISSEGASDRMAENTGLFVIKATGNSSAIVNKADFKPKAF